MQKKHKIRSGSEYSTSGGLKGATDTDYFYFFCPACDDDQIMRVLDYEVREEVVENPYDKDFKRKAGRGFTLAFSLFCEKCKHEDITKISNMGLQGGTHREALERLNA